jgi:hypothetical protein
MNITLAVDEELVKRARKVARAQGKSLNQYIREQLEKLTASDDPDGWAEQFNRLSQASGGNSHGRRFNRDEAHDRG